MCVCARVRVCVCVPVCVCVFVCSVSCCCFSVFLFSFLFFFCFNPQHILYQDSAQSNLSSLNRLITPPPPPRNPHPTPPQLLNRKNLWIRPSFAEESNITHAQKRQFLLLSMENTDPFRPAPLRKGKRRRSYFHELVRVTIETYIQMKKKKKKERAYFQ